MPSKCRLCTDSYSMALERQLCSNEDGTTPVEQSRDKNAVDEAVPDDGSFDRKQLFPVK